MPYLSWISDEKISNCVRNVLSKGFEGIKKSEKSFYRNGIDPFSATFDAACQNISVQEWMKLERTRQAQKSLQNALGNFHQQVLANIESWSIPEENFIDLVCEERKLVVEVKNKHNTVKKSDLKNVYDELQEAVMHKTSRYRGFTGIYTSIIPNDHQRFNREFTPPDNATKTQKSANALIREIDGYSFYAIATGAEHALAELYQALPLIIKAVLAEDLFQTQPQDKLNDLIKSPALQQLFVETFG